MGDHGGLGGGGGIAVRRVVGEEGGRPVPGRAGRAASEARAAELGVAGVWLDAPAPDSCGVFLWFLLRGRVCCLCVSCSGRLEIWEIYIFISWPVGGKSPKPAEPGTYPNLQYLTTTK